MNHFTAIVEYGVGNLMSVTNAMRYLGLATCITSDPAELERAEAIISIAHPDFREQLIADAEKMHIWRRSNK